ncbi:protein LAZ1 homolog 2-like isoform X1 [Miscanthus floridulus]|uniref:protein LAZ1 homolog 2-like isoform X1 n=1 Tax=Miscanthus floridulus TaxID=154761 RepID=UPI003458956B
MRRCSSISFYRKNSFLFLVRALQLVADSVHLPRGGVLDLQLIVFLFQQLLPRVSLRSSLESLPLPCAVCAAAKRSRCCRVQRASDWMWDEAMASDGGSFSSFRELYGNIHGPAVLTGAAFALVALLISLWLILQHLRSYNDPAEQKWIIAVLFMVPVYASESIISLWNSKLSLACDILRNCYEAFALYAFGRYLVACLGGERQVFHLLENRKGDELSEQLLESQDKTQAHNRSRVYNFFCDPNALGENLYTIIKFGLVQYMILKTLCALLALILELFGAYGDGEFKWNYGYLSFSLFWLSKLVKQLSLRRPKYSFFYCIRFINFFLSSTKQKRNSSVFSFFLCANSYVSLLCCFLTCHAFICRYPYIAVVINFSQTWALYCLVKFYNATHEKLQAIRPLAKFISFKAIVFATWWQGVGIAIICQTGLLPKEGKVQNALQDFLICIEMAIGYHSYSTRLCLHCGAIPAHPCT